MFRGYLILLLSVLNLPAIGKVPENISDIINKELVGFARSGTTGENSAIATYGGRDGELYRVNTLKDDENCDTKSNWSAGSLRCAAESQRALWIIFEVSGTINLTKELYILSNKTIDARGASITIAQYTLYIGNCTGRGCENGLYYVNNVILLNLKFIQSNLRGSTKAVKIWGSKNVWVHHCTFYTWEDGMVYVRWKATNITLSWNRFENPARPRSVKNHYHRAILVGTGTGKGTFITIHHNLFKNILNRTPRISQDAYAHVYNNLILETRQHSVSSVDRARVYLEKNIFKNGLQPELYAVCDWPKKAKGRLKLKDNKFDLDQNKLEYFKNIEKCEPDSVKDPLAFYAYEPDEADSQLEQKLLVGSGTIGEAAEY